MFLYICIHLPTGVPIYLYKNICSYLGLMYLVYIVLNFHILLKFQKIFDILCNLKFFLLTLKLL